MRVELLGLCKSVKNPQTPKKTKKGKYLMRVTSLELSRFRSFVHMGPIDLGQINVLIGANNAGKSSILRGLYSIQQGLENPYSDVRVGGTSSEIGIGIEDISASSPWGALGSGKLSVVLNTGDRRGGTAPMTFVNTVGTQQGLNPLPAVEPHHFIVPYLSKRKTAVYQEDVRSQHAMQIGLNMSFLAAKLSRISNSSYPGHDQYSKTCKEILGFMVSAIPSDTGQRPGVYLPNRETIPIDQMGEGVPNIVGLLADLAQSEGKLFLVEEPENDLHPKALKALLDLILESSKVNQFVVSTHSNIVLRHLGAGPSSRVFEVTAKVAQLPIEAEIRLVENTPQARLEVLRDLGYEFSDFDLWDGWLILEEASAERIIRDYLIPWFAPKLTRVRTLSVSGTGNVGPTFEDFNRLVRFTHLEKVYQNAAWVRVDGDPSGKAVVNKLIADYKDWEPDRFAYFSQSDFEFYYPSEFAEQVAEVLAIADKRKKKEAKRELLNVVLRRIKDDPEKAKVTWEKSAMEVIYDLRKIETQLK